jgi:hypothetical protein
MRPQDNPFSVQRVEHILSFRTEWSGINADAMIVWETGWSYAVLGNYDAPAAQAVAGALLAAAVAQPPSGAADGS